MSSQRISGFVITYNREDLIATCLRSIRFVDELIVVDKSSTDGTRAIAERYADRVITVPWSPTVEESRAAALAACRHDWIAYLDDDEMFSPAAIALLRRPPRPPIAAYGLPRRHYILGRFDPRSYHWPEHVPRFFRRDAVAFNNTVHGGMRLLTEHVETIPADSDVCIHHLSHRDAAQWIEKTNRYTSRPDRVRCQTDTDLIGFAHARIDHWMARTRGTDGGDYPAAVALLRAIYDMVDRVKCWEEAQGQDGAALLAAQCEALDRAYEALESRVGLRP